MYVCTSVCTHATLEVWLLGVELKLIWSVFLLPLAGDEPPNALTEDEWSLFLPSGRTLGRGQSAGILLESHHVGLRPP